MKQIANALIIGLLIFFSFHCGMESATAPERPRNVSINAQWFGGVDGGKWYWITKVISDRSFKIRIYHDFTGEVVMDTVFILNPECSTKTIDSNTLLKNISDFDGEKIYLNLPEKNKLCSLAPL